MSISHLTAVLLFALFASVIFGITLRVLTLLSDQLGVPLPMLEEIPQLRRAAGASR